MTIKNSLQKALRENSYELDTEVQEKLITYLNLLEKWNRVFNLTAIRDPQDMVMLHLLDSLSVNAYLDGHRIIDVGTGAGLPGIPLALLNPHKHFTLLDSNSKKTRFLINVVQELKINNIEVVHSRCEDFRPDVCFDIIVTRAFASITTMLVATQHLLCKGGKFLAMKGVYPEQEIKDIPADFSVLNTHQLKIKGLDAERCLVCVTPNHEENR